MTNAELRSARSAPQQGAGSPKHALDADLGTCILVGTPQQPHLLSEAELIAQMVTNLATAPDELRRIGEILSQMALEARNEYESRGGARARRIYRFGAWSYSALSAVIAAAVGGTVLALSGLPYWARFIVAGLSLVAAGIGALNPATYLAQQLQRRDLFWSFHRWTWQYILVDLPSAQIVDARARLAERSTALDTIRGVSWLAASRDGG